MEPTRNPHGTDTEPTWNPYGTDTEVYQFSSQSSTCPLSIFFIFDPHIKRTLHTSHTIPSSPIKTYTTHTVGVGQGTTYVPYQSWVLAKETHFVFCGINIIKNVSKIVKFMRNPPLTGESWISLNNIFGFAQQNVLETFPALSRTKTL